MTDDHSHATKDRPQHVAQRHASLERRRRHGIRELVGKPFSMVERHGPGLPGVEKNQTI